MAPRRRRRALLTRVSTAPDRLQKSGRTAARPLAVACACVISPDRSSARDWLARRPFPRPLPIGCFTHPHGEDHSPSSPLQPPPPQLGFHPGGRGAGAGEWDANDQWGSGERAERWAPRRPAGEGSANGRASHIPGPAAPPLAARVLRVAPSATPDCPWLLRGAQERGAGRPGAAIVSSPALPTRSPARF